jgi:hypothetical protein
MIMSKSRHSEPKTYEFGFVDQMQKADSSLFRNWWDRTCLLADVTPAMPKPSAEEPAQPDVDELFYRLAS